jgi:hypothetical protein
VTKRLTTADFIERAKNKHGDRFTYDNADYRGYDSPVLVTCRKHGDFSILARHLIYGQGCQNCDKELAESQCWIKGYENRYAIRKDGTVISFVVNRRGLPVVPTKNPKGYWVVNISNAEGVRRNSMVSRALAEAHIPNPENKPNVLFENGDFDDIRLENLFWGDRILDVPEEKRCTGCDEILPIEKFGLGRIRGDGTHNRIAKCGKCHYERNDPVKRQGYIEKYRQDNKDVWRKARAKRRAAKLNRTPAWADADAIDFFYECCPKGCHVDHIIPLQGDYISGLHIETNLQWMPAKDNIAKGKNF